MQKVKFLFGLAVAAAIIFTSSATTHAQQMPKSKIQQSFEMGRGMSPINADLMEIAIGSDFFLRFRDAIKLTSEQRRKLEETFFGIQTYTVRRKADLDVTDAEVRRLLSSDRVNLVAVRAKVAEIESIQSEATFKRIEATLKAISVLTHEQHLRVMLLARGKATDELPLQNSL